MQKFYMDINVLNIYIIFRYLFEKVQDLGI